MKFILENSNANMAKDYEIEDQILEAKAKEILELHLAFEDFNRRTEEAAKEAALKAWEAGKLLLEVKESMGHGEWMPWLRKQLPGLSQATVYRYRKIAEFFRTREEVASALEEHECLKGLYKAAGAIGSEGESKKNEAAGEGQESELEPDEQDPVVQLQRTLCRLRKVEQEMLKVVGAVPPEKWTLNEKVQLISAAKALLRMVNDNGWWDEIIIGEKSSRGKEGRDEA